LNDKNLPFIYHLHGAPFYAGPEALPLLHICLDLGLICKPQQVRLFHFRNKMLKFDKKTILSHEYLRKQFDAKNPMSKLVSKRKKAPHKAMYMWTYNRMHQKDIFFFEPLVHGMCTSLQNTHKAEFPQGMAAQGMAAQDMNAQDMAAQGMAAQGMNAQDMAAQDMAAQGMDAREAGVLDLNMIPQEMDAQEEAVQDMDAQEAVVLDLNMIPQEMDA
jgi:hypothetical protein